MYYDYPYPSCCILDSSVVKSTWREPKLVLKRVVQIMWEKYHCLSYCWVCLQKLFHRKHMGSWSTLSSRVLCWSHVYICMYVHMWTQRYKNVLLGSQMLMSYWFGSVAQEVSESNKWRFVCLPMANKNGFFHSWRWLSWARQLHGTMYAFTYV
jgi:hypothetical protein